MTRTLLIAAALVATSSPILADEDLSPDAWVTQATCQDVLARLADPFAFAEQENMFSTAGYLGAIMGITEGVRLASHPDQPSEAFRDQVGRDCTSHPQQLYATVLTAL